MRIVSLVPSSTETLIALGAEVVGCTRYCEQAMIEPVGGTKNPDIERIVELQPDLVVVDEEENRREDADALERAGLEVLATGVRDVDGAYDVVAQFADLIGAPVPPRPARRPSPTRDTTVFVPIWRRPWMTIGIETYGASVLAALGFTVEAGGVPGRYPRVDLDQVAARRPLAVLVPSEPYEFRDGHLAELAAAFPAAAVVRIDGRDLFWWGTRTPGAIQRLGAELDPLREELSTG